MLRFMFTRVKSSLGLQIASFFSVLIILMTIFGGVASAIQQRRAGERAIQNEARAIAQVAATSSTAAAFLHQRNDIADIVKSLEQLPTFEFVVIRTFTEDPLQFGAPHAEGDTLYTRNFDRAPAALQAARSAASDRTWPATFLHDGMAVATVPIVDPSSDAGVIGEVALGISTHLMEASINRSLRALLLVSLLSILLFSAVTFIFVRRLARPLLVLRDASLQVSQGDLTQSLDTDAINEIGTLTRTFNMMVGRLREARDTQELLLRRSDALLLNVLPASIADRLKQGETTIADYIEDCTVLFADIVGFTEMSSKMSPDRVVEMLNEIFSIFDRLADRHGLEKIKMIGDAYMAASGIPQFQPDHAERVARFALEMQRIVVDMQGGLRIRVGIHSGPVVAGVIGTRKFIYDVWGDTVNTASRMESNGVPGKIQITDLTYRKIKHRFVCEERGTIMVKGKGELHTYFLEAEQVVVSEPSSAS